MFRQELYASQHVYNYMHSAPEYVYEGESMDVVMHKFEKTNAQYLPVVDMSNHLVGYIDRTRMYSMYRKMVADFSAE